MNLFSLQTVRALLKLLKVSFLAGLLLVGMAEAGRSGGGFGGRSSGSSSRSGGGYSGGSSGYSRGGGYGGPIIINNGSGWGGGYYGGGYGPTYVSTGFGLGGILMMLLLGAIVFFVIMGLMRNMRRGLGGGGDAGPQGRNFIASDSGTTSALMVLVIMTEGDEVKRALQRVAESGDPDSDAGLAQMLQEAALVVLRHPERWAYGTVMQSSGSQNQTDAQLGAWATQMRAAFSEQTTSNYQNRDLHSGYSHNAGFTPQKNAGDLYLAVSVGAAVHNLALPAAPVDSRSVQSALQTIASVNPDDLIRAEVVWSPDAPSEFLSEDEAISLYPQAKKL